MTLDNHDQKQNLDKNRHGVHKPQRFPSHADPSQKKAGNAKMIPKAGKNVDIIKNHVKLWPSKADGKMRLGETSPGGKSHGNRRQQKPPTMRNMPMLRRARMSRKAKTSPTWKIG